MSAAEPAQQPDTPNASSGARARARSVRQRLLGVPVTIAEQTEASYGAALLALHAGPP